MISLIGVSACKRSATARTAMSRSVIMPTNRSFSGSASVELGHQLRSFANRLIGTHHPHIAGHCLLYFHRVTSSSRTCGSCNPQCRGPEGTVLQASAPTLLVGQRSELSVRARPLPALWGGPTLRYTMRVGE